MVPNFKFVLCVLAIFRICWLLSHDDGPFEIIVTLRKRLGDHGLGALMDCFSCLSIWASIPFALWLGGSPGEKVLYWGALSGAVVFLWLLIR